jgi:hypothetical protein
LIQHRPMLRGHANLHMKARVLPQVQ